jgi:glycine dehydrogenase subunit 1
MGPRGLHEVATQSHHKAHYLAQKLSEISGVELLFASPFFHEFAVRLPRPINEVNARLIEYSFIGGYDLSRDYPELGQAMLLCCTEKRSRAELDKFVDALRTIIG